MEPSVTISLEEIERGLSDAAAAGENESAQWFHLHHPDKQKAAEIALHNAACEGHISTVTMCLEDWGAKDVPWAMYYARWMEQTAITRLLRETYGAIDVPLDAERKDPAQGRPQLHFVSLNDQGDLVSHCFERKY